MAVGSLIASRLIRVRPDKDRHLLTVGSDAVDELTERIIVRRRQPVRDEGGIDQIRIEFDDVRAGLKLCL